MQSSPCADRNETIPRAATRVGCHNDATKLGGRQAVKLIPKTPPGRPNRKLLAHLDEIKRLRIEGYSVAVIHQTLIEAGILVSLRTVFFEVAKLSGTTHPPGAEAANSAPPTPSAQPSTGDPIKPPEAASSVTKHPFQKVDIDEFFRNPLKHDKFLKGRLK